MNKLHYIQVILLIAAIMFYLTGLTYLNETQSGGVGIIESISSIGSNLDKEETSSFSSSSETYLEPVGLSITEKSGAYVIIGLSFLILAWIIFTAINERKKHGLHTVQLPLISVSLLLAVTFGAQLIRSGAF